jgi:hypothetical protein
MTGELRGILNTNAQTGMVWLVRNGKSYVNISSEIEGSGTGFLTEKAPRTGNLKNDIF